MNKINIMHNDDSEIDEDSDDDGNVDENNA